ncbi:MAG: amidohydrolase family protein [Bacteroidota bacterium]
MILSEPGFGKYFIGTYLLFLLATNTTGQKNFLVIRRVNVVNLFSGKLMINREVIIIEDKIYFIGKKYRGKIPSNVIYLDGKGKYLLPGFWDMHFHLCWQKNNDSLLYPALLKNGITGIRDMGGDLNIMKAFKSGALPGPGIYGAGPMIDGDPPVHTDFSLPVNDRSNIKQVLDSLVENGADFFKTYSLLKENELTTIAEYAKLRHLSFAGHLSEFIDPERSILLGQKSIEHLNRLDEIYESDSQRLENIANLMATNKTFLCPTLLTYQLKTRIYDSTVVNNKYNHYVPAVLKQEWQVLWQKRREKNTTAADMQQLNKTYLAQKNLVNKLFKSGIKILAGSDFAGMPYVYPGISLHQEIILLAQAGLSNLEAIKTATLNPAIYFSQQHLYGSVSAGKIADLVLLNRNPLERIENISTINTVINKGKIVPHY